VYSHLREAEFIKTLFPFMRLSQAVILISKYDSRFVSVPFLFLFLFFFSLLLLLLLSALSVLFLQARNGGQLPVTSLHPFDVFSPVVFLFTILSKPRE
jgi:hypothetical protein